MNRPLLLLGIVFVCVSGASIAQPAIGIGAQAGVAFPLFERTVYAPGISAGLAVSGPVRNSQIFGWQGAFDFDRYGFRVALDGSLNFVRLGALLTGEIRVADIVGMKLGAGADYSIAIMSVTDGEPELGYFPGFSGMAGLTLFPDAALSVSLRTRYGISFARDTNYQSIRTSLALQWSPGQSGVLPEGLEIEDIRIDPLFASLYKYYDTNPVGSVKLTNRSNRAITGIAASFFVAEYMDFPKESPPLDTLEPGETATVDLYCLFNNSVLDVSEDTPLSAQVSFAFNQEGRIGRVDRSTTFTLLNRNALTWSDDRKLASFITPRDPSVRSYSAAVRNVLAGESLDALNEPLQVSMQMFDALSATGVTYAPDPTTPFATLHATGDAIDYVQFPRETLRYRTGDCDDLTTLFCALLQSAGYSTALVTGPGHILAMVDSGIDPGNVGMVTADPDLAIVHQGRVWIPVETTLVGSSFQDAWESGASTAGRWIRAGQAATYPVDQAWSIYQPVTLREWSWEPDVPPKEEPLRRFTEDRSVVANREIVSEREQLLRRLEQYGESARILNQLGILHARYGKYPEAFDYFLRAHDLDTNYKPAITNLGNLQLIDGDPEGSAQWYLLASQLPPPEAENFGNLARAYYLMGRQSDAEEVLQKATELDPQISERHSFASGPNTGARGMAAADLTGDIVWDFGSEGAQTR